MQRCLCVQSVHACTCKHRARGSQVQTWVLRYSDNPFSQPGDKHMQRGGAACTGCRKCVCGEGGLNFDWLLSPVPSLPLLMMSIILSHFRVKSGSQRHSRDGLLQIQGKQMEMRLSQLDSMLCVRSACVRLKRGDGGGGGLESTAKYSYCFLFY